jgi:hypothetical protein
MNDYRFRIYEDHFKCVCAGEWDGTYETEWVYEVYDWKSGVLLEVQPRGTEQKAREAGEKALERWRARG